MSDSIICSRALMKMGIKSFGGEVPSVLTRGTLQALKTSWLKSRRMFGDDVRID